VIHRYWPFGLYIKELPIESEGHWKNLVGYFETHGYFGDDKGYQGRLPEWAVKSNRRIKRYGTMKGGKYSSRMRQDETSMLGEGGSMGVGERDEGVCMVGKGDDSSLFEGDAIFRDDIPGAWADGSWDVSAYEHGKGVKHERKTYRLILESCGARTRIVTEGNSSTSSYISILPYHAIKAGWVWEYIEGKGLTQVLDKGGYNSFIMSLIKMEDIYYGVLGTSPPCRNDGAQGARPEQSERAPCCSLKSNDGDEQGNGGPKVPVLSMDDLGILMGMFDSSTLRENTYEGQCT
jgi:hypothetical protein